MVKSVDFERITVLEKKGSDWFLILIIMFMHHFQSGTFCEMIINPTLKLFIMPSEPLSNDHDSSAS